LARYYTRKKITIQRVLQEYGKYEKYSQASFVVIGFDLVQNIKISYSDNGIGFDKKFNFKNGLQNVENYSCL
jgi:signal transduction histidine kinase